MSAAFRMLCGRGTVAQVSYARRWQISEFSAASSLKESTCSRSCSSNAPEPTKHGDKVRDPRSFFFSKDIQQRLMQLNLKDISKVFQRKKYGRKLQIPEVKFLTQEELEKEEHAAKRRAKYFLQCPPVLFPRDEINEILSKDPELQGVDEDKSTFIFTDISPGVISQQRMIVAREPDGTLRKASWAERHRMNQIYFPEQGRSIFVPKMFEPDNIKHLLDRSEFEFLLDRACIQFEPDDPEYVRVTSETYNYIDDHASYDLIRGTRHFGSLVFFLCFHGKIDKILLDCISKYNIDDAVTIIEVFYCVNPNQSRDIQLKDETEFIEEYIDNCAVQKSELKKMLQAYRELKLKDLNSEYQETQQAS